MPTTQSATPHNPSGLPDALSILDALDALVYVADMDTYEILFANRRACADLGQDLVGQTCWKTLQEGQDGPCPFCTNHLLRDAAGNPRPPHTWEFRNTRNGRWYHIVDQAMPWSDGRLVRVEIATDITARRQAEDEVRSKNEFLNALFRNAPYAMLLVNRDCRVVDANLAAASRMETQPESLLGLLAGEVLNCLNSFQEQGCGKTPACSTCPVGARIAGTLATGQGVSNAEGSLQVLAKGSAITIHFLVSTELVRLNGEDLVLVSLADITARKQAEERVAQSERKFRHVLEQVPLIGISLDPEGRLTFANDHFLELTGWSREEVLGRDWYTTFLPPGLRREVQDVIAATLAGKAQGEYSAHENDILTRDGRRLTVAWANVLTRDGRGSAVDVTCLGLDLTERKRAEAALSQSEARFRALFENAPLAYQSLDETGHFLDVNRIWLDVLGYAKEEVIGKWFGDFLAPDFREHFDRNFPMFKQACLIDGVEFQMLRKDGSRITVSFNGRVQLDTQGNFQRTHCIFTDVTERRRAEEALRLSEERFRSVVEATPLGIHFFELAPDGRLVFTGANPAADKILGIRHADLAGLAMEDAFPYHRNTELPAVYRRVATQGDRFAAAEYAYEDKRIVGDFDVWAFPTSSGRMAAMFMDVSQRKRAAAELMAAKLAAEEANRAKSEFLATMSHEIRTPLNGVMGMLQLAAGEDLPPEVKGYLDTALQASRNLLRVLSDILDLSRIEAGAMPIDAEAFELETVLTPVVEAFRPEARAKGLALELAVDPAAPRRLVGDAGRIRQVLFNLVANAVKYSEAGSIQVEAYALPGFSRPGVAALHLAVTDTGPGIPDEQLRRAFEPFSQLDGTATRRHGGTGLGLAIVRRLVALMQGTLAFCSEPGRGTEAHLTLWLPLAAERTPAATRPGDATSDRLTGARILVVEDEPVNRMAVTLILEKLGLAPTAAESGHAALRLLARQPFDCVLMDIQMPGMDGLETTHRIRAAAPGTWDPHIPVLALTAHAMKGDQERFLAAGMDGYIAKPVDMDELRRAIEVALNRASDPILR